MRTFMRRLYSRYVRHSLWAGVVPTLIMLALALTLTAVMSANTTAAAQADADAIAQTPPGQPVCESCHVDTGTIWESSTHAKTGEVTCESCHGPYKEGHPKAETMLLPMESETCQGCHAVVFSEWQTSAHGQKGLDCYDCHQAHTQGLRMSSQNELCAACHSDEQTKLAHSIHGISGVDCDACHMRASEVQTDSGPMTISDHTFGVGSDVCTRCHTSSIHSESQATQPAADTAQTDQVVLAAKLNAQQTAELEQALNAAEKRNTDLRNLAVVGMGLMLGVGGVLGLVTGIAGTALLSRRKRS